MTDRAQFEAMLDALINEDQETAKEIFHNIVVAKSREIYEELLSEDFDLNEKSEEEEEESMDEASEEEEEESVEEAFGEEEEEEEEESDDDEGDSDEAPSFDSEQPEGDLEDRVLDIEDALNDLRAEFDQLMADEQDEPEHDDMFGNDDMGGMDDMGGDEFGPEEPVDELAAMLEYVNAVAKPKHGDNGQNTKSLFNKPKYNDMGGTAPKFGGEAKGEGTKGGLLNPATKEENFGNINVPGAKAAKSAFTHKEPGHGPEKKGQSEKADNKKSLIGGKK
jgi:hypothetical protein